MTEEGAAFFLFLSLMARVQFDFSSCVLVVPDLESVERRVDDRSGCRSRDNDPARGIPAYQRVSTLASGLLSGIRDARDDREAARVERSIGMPRACVRARHAACRSARLVRRLAGPILSSRGLL